MKLLVYLDSSDWSNIAAAASEGVFREREKWLGIRARLLAARDSGRAEFRFSQAIVAEAYPLSATHDTHGLARARAITELCGSLCMVESNTLARFEIRRLASGSRPPFDRGIALRDDGAWHADPDELGGLFGSKQATDGRSLVRDALKDTMPGLTRKARRQVEEAAVDANGQLRPWARERMLSPEVLHETRAEAATRMGLAYETPGMETFLRVVMGELQPEEADKWMLGLLRDLPTLFALFQTREQAEELFGYIRRLGGNILGPMGEAARNMENFVKAFGLKQARTLHAERPFFDPMEWRAKARKQMLDAMWGTERKRRGSERRIRGEVWFSLVDGSTFGSIPSFDCFLTAGAALLGKVAQVSAQPYRGRESDVGDILHMSYLPYVDVFRCDRGNAQVANAVVSEFGLKTQVSPYIEDVLDRLEQTT